jgi:hypothetical protein
MKHKINSVDKILIRLDRLIAEADSVRAMKYNLSEADLWKRSAKTLLERVGNETHTKDFNAIFSSSGGTDNETLEQKWHSEDMAKAKNLLIAVRDDTELFKDEEMQKTAKKIKRSFGIKGKLPGVAEAEYKAEDAD